MKRIWVAVMLLGIALQSNTISMLGAGPPSGAKTAPGSAGKVQQSGRPFRGKIKSFDPSSGVLVLTGAKAQNFIINAETRIMKDDQPGSSKDLVAGEPVTGYARETPAFKWEARTVYVGKHEAKSKSPQGK